MKKVFILDATSTIPTMALFDPDYKILNFIHKSDPTTKNSLRLRFFFEASDYLSIVVIFYWDDNSIKHHISAYHAAFDENEFKDIAIEVANDRLGLNLFKLSEI